MTIDGHTHLWQLQRQPQPWIAPDEMAALNRDFWVDELESTLNEAVVDSAIVVQALNSPLETRDLLAASQNPVIRGVVGWLDLEGDVAAALGSVESVPGSHNLVGIRHLAHLDPDPEWFLRPRVGKGLERLGTAGLPFDIVIRPEQLPAAAAMVAAHQKVMFVLDHLGKPPIASNDLSDWKRDLKAIAALPNVVAKVSGLITEADWATWKIDDIREAVDTALDAFGASRLMFGSDWPVVELAGGPVRWKQAVDELTSALSASERDQLFTLTASGTYVGDHFA
jgi:L-fuconolactonase